MTIRIDDLIDLLSPEWRLMRISNGPDFLWVNSEILYIFSILTNLMSSLYFELKSLKFRPTNQIFYHVNY